MGLFTVLYFSIKCVDTCEAHFQYIGAVGLAWGADIMPVVMGEGYSES